MEKLSMLIMLWKDNQDLMIREEAHTMIDQIRREDSKKEGHIQSMVVPVDRKEDNQAQKVDMEVEDLIGVKVDMEEGDKKEETLQIMRVNIVEEDKKEENMEEEDNNEENMVDDLKGSKEENMVEIEKVQLEDMVIVMKVQLEDMVIIIQILERVVDIEIDNFIFPF